MSAELTLEQDWILFRDELAAILRLSAQELPADAVIGDDVDLDSLALSELSAFVFDQYGVDFLEPGATAIAGITLGALHRRLLAG